MLPHMYIIVSNYSAVVGMYTVTCLTAWNIGNIKHVWLVSRKSLDWIFVCQWGIW